ncbi:MAG TPA: hypothetical protein VM554_13080 [Acidisarcina sp.]|nr:hypothetical protein [Acidisarcina sp.]
MTRADAWAVLHRVQRERPDDEFRAHRVPRRESVQTAPSWSELQGELGTLLFAARDLAEASFTRDRYGMRLCSECRAANPHLPLAHARVCRVGRVLRSLEHLQTPSVSAPISTPITPTKGESAKAPSSEAAVEEPRPSLSAETIRAWFQFGGAQ